MKRIAILSIIICVALGATLQSCGGAKLATANEQYERGEYFDAAKTYRKIYNKLTKKEERPQRGAVAYQMAECYRKLSQFQRAAAAYQNAIRYEYPDSMAILHLAQMQHASGQYGAAVKAYQDFLDLKPGDVTATEGLVGAQMGLGKDKGTRYVVRKADLFNSPRSDFGPMYVPGQYDRLYFGTTREKVNGPKSEITGMKKGDIYVSTKNEKGEWQRPEAVEGELNTEMDEGIISFSPDGNLMYLTRARREPNKHTTVEIFTSSRNDAQWSAPVKFEVINDTLSAMGHPAVSPDGSWLYFSSDMPGGSGGRDIWRINLKDKVGSLENLGEWINTSGDEMFPYVRTDSVLYFASTGHPGFGGLDLFRAQLKPSGGWQVENMGRPINSSSDDFGITFG